MNPTFLLSLGEFGQKSVARLPAESLPRLLVRHLSAQPDMATVDTLFEEAGQALKSLLRTSAAQQSSEEEATGARLDLVLLADVLEVGAGQLIDAAQRLSALLFREFAVIFPPSLPPEQRAVGLVVVLATPAFDGSPGCRAALLLLRALERWHLDGPPSPILNRIYVLPAQTEAMPLSREDRERAAANFLLAAYGSELRDTEAIRARLGPPRQPTALLSSFAVAASDVDVVKLREAFAWRSALSGLSTLVEHCERALPREQALAIADELRIETWFQPLALLANHPDAAADQSSLKRWLHEVDRTEAEALQQMRSDVERLIGQHLTGTDGLRGLHLLRTSLAVVGERLLAMEQSLIAAFAPQLRPETGAEALIPSAALQAGVVSAEASATDSSLAYFRPLSTALLAGASVGTAVMIALAMALSRSMVTTAAAGPVVSGAVPVDWNAVWGGLVFGAVVAAGCGALLWPKKRVKADALSVDEAAARTERQRQSARVAADLQVRRRRLHRSVRLHLAALIERLEVLQVSVIDARERALEQLRTLGTKVGQTAAEDDYRELLEQDTPLHRTLLTAEALPGLWERSQALRDPEIWARELLTRSWPVNWQTEDLPFAPGGEWEAELSGQHRMLRETGVFSWPELGPQLSESLRSFLTSVPRALAFGLRAREPDGTPSPLREAHQTLLLVPSDGRVLLDRILRNQPLIGSVLLPCERTSSRLLLLRTSGELEIASVERSLS